MTTLDDWLDEEGIKQECTIVALQRVYPLGTMMTKIKGSSWTGKVVGYYSTELTANGLCIESIYEQGSVQIYPVAALRRIEDE